MSSNRWAYLKNLAGAIRRGEAKPPRVAQPVDKTELWLAEIETHHDEGSDAQTA
jgi:hypothetical protein